MNRTCENCRAFQPFSGLDDCDGECRATTPAVRWQSERPFPSVFRDDWCLDWQAKEKPKAEKPSSYRRAMQSVTNPSEFDQFWAEFPKKIGKKAAQKAFQNAQDRPPINDLIQSIHRQRASPQWAKDGGQFIPHPATWLNRGQWADVPPETKPSVFEEFLARGEGHDSGAIR